MEHEDDVEFTSRECHDF